MRWLLLVVLCGIMATAATNNIEAQGSTLRQFITAVDCDHMTVETGSGVVNNVSCPYFPPVIESITVTQSLVKVKGIYDAVHTTKLRVAFRNVWYVYGVDPELTTDGNVWSITLAREDIQDDPGTYAVVVQSVDESGTMQQDNGNVVIPTPTVPVDSGEPEPAPTNPQRSDVLIPGVPNTGATGFGISALALVIFVLPLLVRWRKKSTS